MKKRQQLLALDEELRYKLKRIAVEKNITITDVVVYLIEEEYPKIIKE